MMDKKKPILRHVTIFSVATLFATAFGFVRQALVGVYLTPQEFGIYNFLFVVISYVNYSDIGINNGTLYEASRHMGSRKFAKSKQIIGQGFSASIYIGLFLSSCLLAVSFLGIKSVTAYDSFFQIAALAVLASMAINFYQVAARIDEKYVLISWSMQFSVLFSLFMTVLAGEFASDNRVQWMLVSWVFGLAVATIFLAFFIRVDFRLRIHQATLKKLIHIGVPITAVPLMFSFFLGVDRWVLVGIANEVQLGYYALGCTFGLALYMVPNSLGIVLFGRFVKNFGAEKSVDQSVDLLLVTSIIAAFLVAFLVGGGILILPHVLAIFFPKYISGLHIIGVILIAYGLLSVVPSFTNFLIAYKKKLPIFYVLLAGGMLQAALLYMFHNKYGMDGMAYITLAMFFLVSLLITEQVLRMKKSLFFWRFVQMLNLYMPFALCLSCCYMTLYIVDGVNWGQGQGQGQGVLLLEVLVYTVTSVVTCAAYAYFSGLSRTIWQLKRPTAA